MMPDANGFATPAEQQAAEQARFNRQTREQQRAEAAAAPPSQGAPAGWFDALAPADQLRTLRAGHRHNSAASPPGPGELRQKVVTDPYTKRVSYEFEGDPAVWMDVFKPPVKQVALGFRLPNETDAWWNAKCERNLEAFKKDCAATGKVWVA